MNQMGPALTERLKSQILFIHKNGPFKRPKLIHPQKQTNKQKNVIIGGLWACRQSDSVLFDGLLIHWYVKEKWCSALNYHPRIRYYRSHLQNKQCSLKYTANFPRHWTAIDSVHKYIVQSADHLGIRMALLHFYQWDSSLSQVPFWGIAFHKPIGYKELRGDSASSRSSVPLADCCWQLLDSWSNSPPKLHNLESALGSIELKGC